MMRSHLVHTIQAASLHQFALQGKGKAIVLSMLVYLSGMPPVLVTYSTLHTCTLPLLLPLAMLWLSSQAVQHNILPPECNTLD